jgi:hypothetical protein
MIANIALNDAMILPYDANPGRMEFSERTAALDTNHAVFSTEQPVVCGLDALLPHGQRRKRPFTNRLRLAFGRVLRRL